MLVGVVVQAEGEFRPRIELNMAGDGTQQSEIDGAEGTRAIQLSGRALRSRGVWRVVCVPPDLATRLLRALMDVLIDVDMGAHTYDLHTECITFMLTLLSTQVTSLLLDRCPSVRTA